MTETEAILLSGPTEMISLSVQGQQQNTGKQFELCFCSTTRVKSVDINHVSL